MSDSAGKVISCKAAVAWAPNEPLTIETVQVAPPRSHEVRIRIVATGVCNTDAGAITGHGTVGCVFPTILGHEGAGIVESIGEGVTKFVVGDHVIPLYISQCNECAYCKSPKTNICHKLLPTQRRGVMLDGTTRFLCKGKEIFHFMGTSTFAEYTVVADISLTKIDMNAPLNKVCLLGCGVSTGYGAALNSAEVEPGSSCGIWGLGGVGLATIMGCRAAGATTIVGIDINPDKFEVASQFGCTDSLNPRDYGDRPIQDVVNEKYGGLDYTFECVGNVNTIRAAFESAAKGWGVAVVVGVTPAGAVISTQSLNLTMGRTWKGTVFGGWKSVDDVPKLVAAYMRHELLVDEFITHTMPLDNINEAFDLMAQGKSIRTVINF